MDIMTYFSLDILCICEAFLRNKDKPYIPNLDPIGGISPDRLLGVLEVWVYLLSNLY